MTIIAWRQVYVKRDMLNNRHRCAIMPIGGGGALMLVCDLYVKIDTQFRRTIDEGWLRRVVEKSLNVAAINRSVELSVVITDDEAIRQLNRDYRGVDEATDVLSFAFNEDTDATTFVSPPDGVSRLGEVLISCQRARSQARQHKHSTRRELALLLSHGVLHLLGYEHEDNVSTDRMKAIEETILRELSHEHLL